MGTSKAAADVTLRLERSIAATPEQVYRAWIEAEALTRWMAPADDFTVVVHAVEARVGGRYRYELRNPDGSRHVVGGEFRVLDRPRKLVFTWAWEARPEEGETQVSVVLSPEGKGTKLVLLHENFLNGEVRDQHRQGWTGCLERLAKTADRI